MCYYFGCCFLQEEQRGDVNYYGFSKAFGFGKGKGGILKTIFEWEGNVKPVRFLLLTIGFYCLVEKLGGGRNVDDQNVDRPKISERRNGLFS